MKEVIILVLGVLTLIIWIFQFNDETEEQRAKTKVLGLIPKTGVTYWTGFILICGFIPITIGWWG